MKRIFNGLYRLTLSLWVGGVVIFTFLVTPALFNSFDREVAGGIVAKLFPLYFPYLLVLEAVALVAFLIGREESKGLAASLPIYLLVGALGVSLFVNYKLYPDIREAKREAASSGRESEFARLHAVSAGLNLLILVDGVALLFIGPALRRREEPRAAAEGAQVVPPPR